MKAGWLLLAVVAGGTFFIAGCGKKSDAQSKKQTSTPSHSVAEETEKSSESADQGIVKATVSVSGKATTIKGRGKQEGIPMAFEAGVYEIKLDTAADAFVAVSAKDESSDDYVDQLINGFGKDMNLIPVNEADAISIGCVKPGKALLKIEEANENYTIEIVKVDTGSAIALPLTLPVSLNGCFTKPFKANPGTLTMQYTLPSGTTGMYWVYDAMNGKIVFQGKWDDNSARSGSSQEYKIIKEIAEGSVYIASFSGAMHPQGKATTVEFTISQ